MCALTVLKSVLHEQISEPNYTVHTHSLTPVSETTQVVHISFYAVFFSLHFLECVCVCEFATACVNVFSLPTSVQVGGTVAVYNYQSDMVR